MPLCILGCDALYERGFLTVSPTGRVVVASDVLGSSELALVLTRLSGRRCLAHSAATAAVPTSEYEPAYVFASSASRYVSRER